MQTEERAPGRAADPATYRWAAVGCAVLVGAVGWTEALVVVGGQVIAAWMAGGALLLACLALVMVASALSSRPSVADGKAGGPSGPRPWMLLAPALTAVLGVAWGVVGDLGVEYHVLEPTGPGGCRAVVREASFLLAGRGEVYAVGPSGVGWKPTGSWTADDGIRPVADGSYELNWGLKEGVLLVHGSNGDPVWPALHRVSCD